jgi:glycosyltransferase involved in cell wall biosynthesis
MRMKVLHAMALGKPVVTTTRGAEGLDVDGARPPVEIGDHAEPLARVAAHLLADANARRALGRRARSYVEAHHSPGAYVDRLERVLAEVLGPRNPLNPRPRSKE